MARRLRYYIVMKPTNELKQAVRFLVVDRPRFATTVLMPGFTLRDAIDEINEVGQDRLIRWAGELRAAPVERITQVDAKWRVTHLGRL